MDGLLKGADDGKTLVYALDLKGVAADEDFMKSLQRQFGPLLGASGDILKHIDSLAADASLKDADGVLRATLACKDAQAAGDAKIVVGAAQAMLRKVVEASARAPQDIAESVGSIALTADGANLRADGKVKIDSLLRWFCAEMEEARKQAMQRAEEFRRLQQQTRPRGEQN